MTSDDIVLAVAPHSTLREVAHLAIAAFMGIPVIRLNCSACGGGNPPADRTPEGHLDRGRYHRLYRHEPPDIKKRNLSSFKKAYSGGAPVSAAIVDQFKDKLTAAITLTE